MLLFISLISVMMLHNTLMFIYSKGQVKVRINL